MADRAEREESASRASVARRDSCEECDRANGGKRAYDLVLRMLRVLSLVVILALLAPVALDPWVWNDSKEPTQEVLNVREKRMAAYFEYYK